MNFDLWTASSIGDLEYIQENLTKDSVNAVNRGHWNCLMYACYYDHAALVAYLISCGCQVQVGSDHRTALMLAASCGHIDVVKILLGIVKDTFKDSKGFTALFHAVLSGHLGMIESLLSFKKL